MANTNYPSATPSTTPPDPKKQVGKIVLIAVLAFALLGTWAYLLYYTNKDSNEKQELRTEGTHYKTERDSINDEYKEAVVRLDSITGANNNMQGEKTALQKEIEAKQSEIRKILNDKNATAGQLKKAKALIADLNGQLATLQAENARLAGENQNLTASNTQLTTEKQSLEQNLQTTKTEKDALAQTVDVGSTFSASNIQITAVDEKKNGKETVTTKANKVNKLVISFDIENRIAKSGPADMYIMVAGPDGKVITDPTNGGTLTTRTEGDKPFTAKVPVEYTQGTQKQVQFPIRQADFQKGDYKIQIYHNGFKIGEGTKTLRKGGLFG